MAEFAELLFPEVEGLEDDEDDHDGSGDQARGVVSDPVLMKLIMVGSHLPICAALPSVPRI